MNQTLVRLERRPRPVPTTVALQGPTLDDLAPVAEFAPLVDQAKKFKDEEHSPRTRREYKKEWHRFEHWCKAKKFDALPALPSTVALYVTYLATTPTRDRHGNVRNARGRSPAGINVAVAAIAHAHAQERKQSPHHHPDVRAILQGIAKRWAEDIESEEGGSRRVCPYCREPVGRKRYYAFADRHVHAECHDSLPPSRKAPLLAQHLVAMVEAQPNRRLGIRNRALLLILWTGAFRCDELVHLTVERLEFCREGVRIRMGRTKNAQTGEKNPKAICYEADESICPVRALKAWLEESGITAGYVFVHVDRWGHLHQRLSGHAVAVLVKKWAPVAGLDPRVVSGHSPRSGLVTAAAKDKRSLWKIMAQTHQRDVNTVLRYVRDEEVFEDNAAQGLLSGIDGSVSPP
jgi:integrase